MTEDDEAKVGLLSAEQRRDENPPATATDVGVAPSRNPDTHHHHHHHSQSPQPTSPSHKHTHSHSPSTSPTPSPSHSRSPKPSSHQQPDSSAGAQTQPQPQPQPAEHPHHHKHKHHHRHQERGRSGGGGVLVTGVGGPDGAGAGAAGGRGAGVDSEPLFPEADVPAPRKLLRLLRLGGAFILLTVAVVYLSQVLAFGLGFVSVITGMVVGLAGGCVVLMILWCGTFKSKVLNEWFFNDARRLFHREQVYPTVVCSSGLIFLLITVPAFVFSSGWLFLKVAPFASVVLDVNTGVPLNNNYTEASVFQFYNARIGTDAISGSADSSGSYTCVAPILGRLETPETPGIEPVTFFAICDTSSNLNCNTEEARSASRCMKKWFDDDAHGGLQSGTTDSVVALSIVENNDTFAYGISENAIVVEWMDVDEEEYVRKITLIIVSTAGDILLLGLMLALYVLFHYRRKALVLMEKNIVTHSHYRHSHI